MGGYRPCHPALVAGLALVLATGGCSSILGDFLIGNVDQDAGTGGGADAGGSEAQADGAPGAEAGGRDASDAAAPRPDTGSGADASDATASDAEGGVIDDAGSGEASPPPIPGKPGFGITAGGNVSRSPNYKLIGAVGESPGGNVIGRSCGIL